MVIEKVYNSNLLKGTGLVQEMLVLIDEYQGEETSREFQKKVIERDLLAKSTENRVIDIVRNVFANRFMNYEMNIPTMLHKMRENYVSINVMTQLFYIYTCRANLILGDFVKEIYFPFVKKGYQKIETNDPKEFIRRSISDGKIPTMWSDSTISKVSEHIIASLIDFLLLEKNKNILPIRVIDNTTNYLVHELHFRGFSDNEIWQHEDWELFGLGTRDVISIIERLSYQGAFVFQFSGELLKLDWKNNSMEEFIENEYR